MASREYVKNSGASRVFCCTHAHNDLTEVLEGNEEEVDEEPAEEEDNEDEIVMTPLDGDMRSRRYEYLILVRILAVAYVPLLHRKHAFGIATEHYMYFREGALRFAIPSR